MDLHQSIESVLTLTRSDFSKKNAVECPSAAIGDIDLPWLKCRIWTDPRRLGDPDYQYW